MSAVLWARQAWIGDAWAGNVTLRADADGNWCEVRADSPCPANAEVLPSAALPGMVNAHSHAFQRAFVGLSERRDGERDDFWSWRDRMYEVALRISPEQLEAVATHLYAELLAGGYTHTCEFQYLHHAPDGKPWSAWGGDDAAMSRALANAAHTVGMGLTIIPVLYERAGFTQPMLRADQRRFATDVMRVLRFRDTIRAWRLPRVDAAVAIHSLRAASPESMRELVRLCADDPAPIHVHIAEQTGEVNDCHASTGMRPIEWLVHEFALDARWQLVHATHATTDEIRAVAATGAGIVLCPGTEANLGDGVCDLTGWLASDAPISLGSDSNVTRSWPDELRLLEYGQRLALRQRNVAADPIGQPSTAARLFARCVAGGALAAGRSTWGFAIGARADLVLVNAEDAALIGVPATHMLDALVFGSPSRPFTRAMVAGSWAPPVESQREFATAMAALWTAAPGPTATSLAR
jgi:formimidoylglutamate deiminase